MGAVMVLAQKSDDDDIRQAAVDTLRSAGSPSRFITGKEAREAEERSVLRPTRTESGIAAKDGTVRLNLPLTANGVNFTIVSPE